MDNGIVNVYRIPNFCYYISKFFLFEDKIINDFTEPFGIRLGQITSLHNVLDEFVLAFNLRFSICIMPNIISTLAGNFDNPEDFSAEPEDVSDTPLLFLIVKGRVFNNTVLPVLNYSHNSDLFLLFVFGNRYNPWYEAIKFGKQDNFSRISEGVVGIF